MKLWGLLLVGTFLSGLAAAGNGVDPMTVQYRDWNGKRPSTIALLGCEPRKDQTGLLNAWLNAGKTGILIWPGQPELAQHGSDLLKRNNFEPSEKGFGDRHVEEIALGNVETIRAAIPESQSHGRCEVVRTQLTNIPPGVKKGILLAVDKSMGIHQGRRVRDHLNHVLVLVFENVSDADLRQLAYEDGVLRAFYFRED